MLDYTTNVWKNRKNPTVITNSKDKTLNEEIELKIEEANNNIKLYDEIIKKHGL